MHQQQVSSKPLSRKRIQGDDENVMAQQQGSFKQEEKARDANQDADVDILLAFQQQSRSAAYDDEDMMRPTTTSIASDVEEASADNTLEGQQGDVPQLQLPPNTSKKLWATMVRVNAMNL